MSQFSEVNYTEQPSEIIAKAAASVATGQPFALVTSLAIEGGAAREVGSLAMVDSVGEMTGYLSNGCIDKDIQHHAIEALQSETKKLIRYGDGSRYVDLKLPCGGALTVLIDPNPDRDAIRDAAKDLAARQTVSLTFRAPEGDAPAMEKTFQYQPPLRLVLAGRGAIFRRMAQVGKATGYEVYAFSPEHDDLSAIAAFLDADPTHLTTPSMTPSLEILDERAAFLTLFHDHDWEPALLKAALGTEAGFIGSLGSRRTHEMRKDSLRQMGVSDASLERLHGPIGLVPSLRDASAIAVSAHAEIISVFQNRAAENSN